MTVNVEEGPGIELEEVEMSITGQTVLNATQPPPLEGASNHLTVDA